MLRMDFVPLRDSREFRLLFTSRSITLFGTNAGGVALLVQAKQLTGSAVAVGLLGIAELVPIVVFGLYGGLLADRFDRGRMLRWCEAGLGCLAGALVLNASLPRPAVWPLYALAAGMSALAALQRPSFDAAVPRTVARERLSGASAMLSMSSNAGQIIGAAVGGAVAAGPGPQFVYLLDAATFAVSFWLLCRLRPLAPPDAGEHTPAPGLRSVVSGLHYARKRPDLIGSYLADLAAMTFAYPTALFPFMASTLHATWAVGLMFSAPAVGALAASALSGWTARVAPSRPGHRRLRGRLGRGDHRVRAGAGHRCGAGLPAGRGSRGHDERDLPRCAVEPEHPGRDAGPDGGRGAAQLRRRARPRGNCGPAASPPWPAPGSRCGPAAWPAWPPSAWSASRCPASPATTRAGQARQAPAQLREGQCLEGRCLEAQYLEGQYLEARVWRLVSGSPASRGADPAAPPR